MIEINLLPKEYLKKGFNLSLGKTGLYAIAGIVGVFIMLAGVSFYQMRQISELDDNIEKARHRANMLKKDIQYVDALIDVKQKISARMLAVERLDSHRSSWVRILEDLGRNVPDYVWMARYTEIKPEDQKKPAGQPGDTTTNKPARSLGQPRIEPTEVEGYTFSLNGLAAFMINMMRSDYFADIELVSLEEKELDQRKAYNFVLSCNLHYLSEEDLRNMIAKTDDTPANNSGGQKSLN